MERQSQKLSKNYYSIFIKKVKKNFKKEKENFDPIPFFISFALLDLDKKNEKKSKKVLQFTLNSV